MPPWTRASGLERELHCPVTSLLPQKDERSAATREAADWGTMVHHWKATGVIRPEPGYPNHAALFAKKLAATGVQRETYWSQDGRHEVAFAVDCTRLGRVAEMQGTKEQVEAWTAALGDEYVKGEADYVGDLFGIPWVDDLKTGRFPPSPDSPQLLFYALGRWLMDGAEARKVIASITHWPRYPVASQPERFSAEFSASALKAFWNQLKMTRNRRMALAKASLPVLRANAVPGEHCTFCHGRNSCDIIKD